MGTWGWKACGGCVCGWDGVWVHDGGGVGWALQVGCLPGCAMVAHTGLWVHQEQQVECIVQLGYGAGCGWRV